MNFKSKACFIGHMVFELLKVIKKDDPPTDRDNYKYKRVQTTGELMKDLFIEYSKEMYTEIYKDIDKELLILRDLYYENLSTDFKLFIGEFPSLSPNQTRVWKKNENRTFSIYSPY